MPSAGRPPGKSLSGLHLRIFAMHMAGKQNVQIASELKISTQTVSNALGSEFFRQAKQDVVENTIRNLSSGAIQTEKFSPITVAKAVAPRMMALNIAIAENPRIAPTSRLKAIHDILDRSYGKATQRVVIDELDSLLERCSDEELEAYSKTGQLPEWASDVNRTVH